MAEKYNNFVGGEVIRHKRQMLCMSSSDVCKRLSEIMGRTYTPTRIYSVESGQLRPSRKLLMGLMTVLSISEEEAREISQDIIDILDCNNVHGNTKK